jgi:hypothetical protein
LRTGFCGEYFDWRERKKGGEGERARERERDSQNEELYDL